MKTTILATSLILLLAGLGPVAAYHIDGTLINDPGSPPMAGGTGTLTTADWVLDTSGLSICESGGANDDRNAQPVTRHGLNGLCTTGENDATGTQPYDDADADTAADQPPYNRWIRLDVCDATTTGTPAGGGRNLVAGPYASGGATCDAGASLSALTAGFPGRHTAHGFTFRVGAFTCVVPTHFEPLPVVTTDWAGYYRAQYAWWSYAAGTPPYTPGDGAGAQHSGDGTGTASNNIDAFHGHATVFPLLSRSEPGASMIGSVETSLAAPPSGLSDDPNVGGVGGGGITTNNCGGSPSNPDCNGCPAAGTADNAGPVVRAPYTVSTGVVDSPIPLCARVWDGVVETNYSCTLPAGAGECTVLGRSLAVASVEFRDDAAFLPTPDTGTVTVTGKVECAGGASSAPLPAMLLPCSRVAAPPPPDDLVTINGICLGANAKPDAIPLGIPTPVAGATGKVSCLRTDTGGNLPNMLWMVACPPVDP